MKKEIDGVKVEAKSIITSLKIIQAVCNDNVEKCVTCPFFNEDTNGCAVFDLRPDNWKINETNTVWRALE